MMLIRLTLVMAIGLCLACSSPSSTSSESNHGMITLNAVDFMGGDLKHLKTPSGAKACAEACSKLADCFAYTYAQPTHKMAKKHNSCWLKKSGFKYNRAAHYISGIKP